MCSLTRTFKIEEDTFPNLPQMMFSIICALKEVGGSATLHELDEKVVEVEGVSEEEQQVSMANDRRPKLNYYLAWSRTYLKRGGALENSARGVWALTPIGEKISNVTECERIHDQVNAEERERARQKRLERKGKPDGSNRGPSSQGLLKLDDADEEGLEEGWKQSLLNTILEMSPDAFERLSQRLLREAGFTKVEVRGKSGDGGIDGLGVLRVNLVSFQVYFQCKRWKGSVGSKEIRDFRGALQGRADKGLFITTGSFTSQASEEATRDGAIAIDLIDGERLCELLKQHSLGVRTQMIEQVEVLRDFFQDV